MLLLVLARCLGARMQRRRIRLLRVGFKKKKKYGRKKMNERTHAHTHTHSLTRIFVYELELPNPNVYFAKSPLPSHKQRYYLSSHPNHTTPGIQYEYCCRVIIVSYRSLSVFLVFHGTSFYFLYDLYISASIGTENNHNYNSLLSRFPVTLYTNPLVF
jgi:hypothetical protein